MVRRFRFNGFECPFFATAFSLRLVEFDLLGHTGGFAVVHTYPAFIGRMVFQPAIQLRMGGADHVRVSRMARAATGNSWRRSARDALPRTETQFWRSASVGTGIHPDATG